MESSILVCTPRLLLGELMASALADGSGIGPVLCVSTPEALLAAARKRPWALVMVDTDSPRKETFPVLDQLRRRRRDLRLLFFADRPPSAWVSKAVELYAVGFVGICCSLANFREIVRMALRGKTCYSPCAVDLLNEIVRGDQTPPSSRDVTVLSLIADGLSSKEMSRILGLSPKGVDAIRSRLMHRSGARSSAALVKYAYDQRLLEVPWKCTCPETPTSEVSASRAARGPRGARGSS